MTAAFYYGQYALRLVALLREFIPVLLRIDHFDRYLSVSFPYFVCLSIRHYSDLLAYASALDHSRIDTAFFECANHGNGSASNELFVVADTTPDVGMSGDQNLRFGCFFMIAAA